MAEPSSPDGSTGTATADDDLVEGLRRNLETAELKSPVRVGTTGPSNALCTFEGLAAGLVLGLCVWFGVSVSSRGG